MSKIFLYTHENDSNIIRLLKDNFGYCEFNIYNKFDGVQRIIKESPDLIIYNLNLDKIEEINNIKENELTDGIPVILLLESSKDIKKLNMDLVLIKPIKNIELIYLVKTSLNLRNAMLELKESEKYRFYNRYITNQDEFPIPIWKKDINGKYYYLNKAYLSFTGKTFEQTIIEGWKTFIYPDKLKKYLETYLDAFNHNLPFTAEYRILHNSGEYKWVKDFGSPYYDFEGNFTGYIGTFFDITDKKIDEDLLRKSLMEQRILFHEIHHRVKNNLQIIISMIGLQMFKANDDNVKVMFKETMNRINSIAFVHELLYQTKSFSFINFTDYIKKLARHLIFSYKPVCSNVDLNIKLDNNLYFNIDTALPCGLLFNELITNSLKHAFPNNKIGTIDIEGFENNEELLTFIYHDNGIGIPENINPITADSLGLDLIKGLINQLHGNYEIKKDHGTKFIINIKKTEEKIKKGEE